MKKITIIVGVVCLMSSCGIQFGNYERWKEIHRGGTCEVEEVDERDYEFTSAYNNCENCDEID
tara:strand:+ start:658 stop:846 length:189 start_codon:yes stop_codon:yes gene_type:complete